MILSYSKQDGEQSYRVVSTKSEEEAESRFQYILAAPTSIVTKIINQGQSYKMKIKKLGQDLEEAGGRAGEVCPSV